MEKRKSTIRKKPPHRAMYLEDALHALADTERTFAELESSDVFQAFTSAEKARYRDVLSRLRGGENGRGNLERCTQGSRLKPTDNGGFTPPYSAST